MRVVAITLGLLVMSLGGCSALKTSVSKAELQVQTQMSSSIFLEPRPPEERIVFVDIRSTTDKGGFAIGPAVKKAIQSHGYTLTEDPDEAFYRLQVNVLKVGLMSGKDTQQALVDGFGGTVAASLIGAAIGLAVGDSGDAAAVGAAIGAGVGILGELASSAVVRDETYTAVADIQISERAPEAEDIWDKYRTRVVGKANQANIDQKQAFAALTTGMATSISGIF